MRWPWHHNHEVLSVGRKEMIASLTEEAQQLQSIETQRTEAPEQQVSLTDPDARSMKTRGTGGWAITCRRLSIASII